MGLYPHKYGLADDCTIKEVNAFKKQSNWGEMPAFFSLVSNSIAEVEGYMSYGFDNAYKTIIDRKNWNYDKLGRLPNVNPHSLELHAPLTKPKLCILHVFSEIGYELLAFPYVNGKVVDEYISGDPNMDFHVWNPTTMKYLVRINQLHKFIAFTIKNGDDADMALIIHAHIVVTRIIEKLHRDFEIVGEKGTDIKAAFASQNINPNLPPEEAIIAAQMENESSSK
ncbi:hypothetical protein KO525_03050 [Psychrosphaera sp. B3R10]|uniref:Uncharacterized protein n=1 Tax=Psychrosphaera algicola TaxID=3023714 RepID=A0ABT5F9B6_9GAMM|nr:MULTISPECIES: hypothetical protein [unclassified Psychrosphaera]MBU2881252.1 hypothetical protein [Psychrosphaera sp. I2R16]MBU2988351.1 hypothetical protein [Psychrosphaera sp. B3R10]MDC2888121.1 hypothetical protein [Psychrosphaera sp. G1-22]MDO6720152.1 hypothetical protein [Psychrosphaera sp. 1_MG-2023]